jgi:hypothetical protein
MLFFVFSSCKVHFSTFTSSLRSGCFYNVTFRVYISVLDVITPFTHHFFRDPAFVSKTHPTHAHTVLLDHGPCARRGNQPDFGELVNQPQAASNSGNLWNGMRQTFSLGCGSWGGNSINHNITWKDLTNETWVSKPLAVTKELRADDDLFARVKGKV